MCSAECMPMPECKPLKETCGKGVSDAFSYAMKKKNSNKWKIFALKCWKQNKKSLYLLNKFGNYAL